MRQIEQALRDAAKSAKQFAYLYESPEITADVAQDYLQHPFPYWVECMVTNYCRTHGGSATKQKLDWNIHMPNGELLSHAVFNLKDLEKSPAATFLAVNNQTITDMLHELVRRNESGDQIPRLSCSSLPGSIHGVFALYKLTVTSGSWNRSRVLPVFLSDDGRAFNSTAKTIHEMLLTGNGFETAGMTDFEPERLWDTAEGILEPYFEELQRIYDEERKRDLKKKSQLFESRRRSLDRVGIENIRLSRQIRLEQERRLYIENYNRHMDLLPDVKLLLAIKVDGGA